MNSGDEKRRRGTFWPVGHSITDPNPKYAHQWRIRFEKEWAPNQRFPQLEEWLGQLDPKEEDDDIEGYESNDGTIENDSSGDEEM